MGNAEYEAELRGRCEAAEQQSEIDAEIQRCQKALSVLEAAIDRMAGLIDPVLSDAADPEPTGMDTAGPSSQLGRRLRGLRTHADALGSYIERLNGRVQL